MISCTNCGRENEDEFKFCLGCGSSLPKPAPAPAASTGPEMMDCPHCGTQVPSNFKFCGACGGAIHSPPAAKQVEQPAPQPEKPRAAAPVGNLTVIRPDGSEGATIPLVAGEVVLGRSSDYDALANDPFLSPHHASIVYDGSRFVLSDQDSLNGVFLRIRGEVELADGDSIRVGQELLRFETIEAQDSQAPVGDEKTKVAGSPDPGFWGRLALVGGPETRTRAFAFADDEITIGRELGTVLFADDGFVSGRHAAITHKQGKVTLKDLGSSNGTYLRIRKDRVLERGDLILMGQQLFRLEI